MDVNESNTSPLAQKSPIGSAHALSDTDRAARIPGIVPAPLDTISSREPTNGHESYERGTALKNVGLFKQAAEHFEQAAQDSGYAVKGFAQMGLCLKRNGNQDQAVEVFRRALQVPTASSNERVQILYLLGRTLESLGRIPETLETYRWLRREAPQYRDVAARIESLSTRRTHMNQR